MIRRSGGAWWAHRKIMPKQRRSRVARGLLDAARAWKSASLAPAIEPCAAALVERVERAGGPMSSRISAFLRFMPPVPLVALVALVSACSTGPSNMEGAVDTLGRSSHPIINGVVDTTHPAVVALLLGKDASEGACTGTIVKKDVERRIGWVATAAHCVEAGVGLVLQTQDHSTTDVVQYSVIDFEADSRFSFDPSGGFDFAVVRIGGVEESTPVIPLATDPDGLDVGVQVTSVGFGTTGAGMNTTRRSVKKPIDFLDERLLGYDQETSGICFGDSGGPVIAGAGANERVVGIHSFVSGGCSIGGFSARVTSGLDFFDEQLEKLPEKSCAVCEKIANGGTSTCAQLTASCLADDECRGYYECIGDGKKTQADCFAEFPIAEGPFTAAKSCVCQQACADECAGEPSCAAVGKCGHSLDDETDACATCIETSCCEQMRECTVDGRCAFCLTKDDSFGSCKRNPARQALATCALDRCANECAGSTLPTIGASAAADPGDAGAAAAPESADAGCSVVPNAQSSWGLSLVGAAAAALIARQRRRRR